MASAIIAMFYKFVGHSQSRKHVPSLVLSQGMKNIVIVPSDDPLFCIKTHQRLYPSASLVLGQ
jgi:hypothetical protein